MNTKNPNVNNRTVLEEAARLLHDQANDLTVVLQALYTLNLPTDHAGKAVEQLKRMRALIRSGSPA